jgi:hypothetical protein
MSLTTYPEPEDRHEEYLYWLQTHQEYDKMTATQKSLIDRRYQDLLVRIDDEYEYKKLFNHEDFRLDY